MDSDAELLQLFSRTGDEAAFGQIVARHAPMMRGVVQRRTGDPALADEVTQTVFAILARKAASLPHESIAGWLHRTAFLEARNAVRKAARYRQVLETYGKHAMPSTEPDSTPDEILPHLDLALTKLKPAERDLVVRRYFEGQSLRDIAVAAGNNEEACRKRLQRTIRRLGQLLRRRGLSTSAASLTALLAGQNFCAPPACAATISTAALKASAALSKTSLFTHSLLLLNTAPVLKTTVVAVIIAAIPVGWLWQQNNELRRKVQSFEQQAVPSGSSEKAAASVSGPLAALHRDGKAGPRVSSPASNPTPAGLASPLLFRETLTEMLKGEAERRSAQIVNRLCSSLPDLTEYQQNRLREHIAGKVKAQIEAAEKLLASGDPNRFMHPELLTEEERTQFAAVGAEDSGVDPATLGTILTADQLRHYEAAEEGRRVTGAENAANDTLRQMDQYVDLTREQRDDLFQKLASSHLAENPQLVEGEDAEKRQEELIRSVLTPRQAEVYDAAREQEKKSMERLRKLVPNLTGKDPGVTP